MKGDFTRFSHDPMKRYTRVLKQQGRVDLDADWNEAAEIFTQLERTEALDVIGRCGVPEHSNGYKIELNTDGSNLTISRGRIYVNGMACSNETPPDDPGAGQPVAITDQADELPGYPLPDADGVYLAYADVWERHITSVEDPDLREVALGGPDTTTRTRTQCQVKLELLDEDGPLEAMACRPFSGIPNTGRLAARTEEDDRTSNPCLVPAGAGYRGLENRLYRVEIHDDGRDAEGNQVRTPTFKWSRDNGSVVLPIAVDGIAGQDVTLKRFGPDDVLTVKVGDWVEVSGDETELYGRHGTLGQIEPDGIDRADLEITLSEDVSLHQGEAHLKLRRWDHHATDEVALQDGALPIQGNWFELEDGVQVRFDDAATYHVGDYWVIPARTPAKVRCCGRRKAASRWNGVVLAFTIITVLWPWCAVSTGPGPKCGTAATCFQPSPKSATARAAFASCPGKIFNRPSIPSSEPAVDAYRCARGCTRSTVRFTSSTVKTWRWWVLPPPRSCASTPMRMGKAVSSSKTVNASRSKPWCWPVMTFPPW